jgi:hypothetical protein
LFDKKKGKLFFTVFFSSAKKSCFSTSAPGLFSTRTKKQWNKVFSFIEHEVLFYETPFLHRAGTIYVCGQSEEVSSSGGVESILERPITCVSALYDARQAS